MGKLASIAKVISPVASFLGPVGQIVGAISGAASMMDKPKAPPSPPKVEAKQEEKFKPIRPDAIARPGALNELAAFTEPQERSALANMGVQKGLGADEDAYYRNLIQRSLIGEGNKVASDTSGLLPVESQYLSSQGINTSDIMELLKQIRG